MITAKEKNIKILKFLSDETLFHIFFSLLQKTMIDDQHPLLQSRPNFSKALKDFDTFLTATLEDLQTKTKVLNNQKSKTSRNVKNYLSLQIYLLQKHLRRLDEFQSEIHSRVTCIFNQQLTQNEADQQFLKLLADMSKMKTRCKHILDVTDRYCVLQEQPEEQGHFPISFHSLTLKYF